MSLFAQQQNLKAELSKGKYVNRLTATSATCNLGDSYISPSYLLGGRESWNKRSSWVCMCESEILTVQSEERIFYREKFSC